MLFKTFGLSISSVSALEHLVSVQTDVVIFLILNIFQHQNDHTRSDTSATYDWGAVVQAIGEYKCQDSSVIIFVC